MGRVIDITADESMSEIAGLDDVRGVPRERRARDVGLETRRPGKQKRPARVRRLPARRDVEAPAETEDDIAEPIGPGDAKP
jgi:hypothetical protein